ncbi:MAG: MotA/TolQ/ExbB proton channel family protein [bacterium]|nr:MotA/TolQ/ExbB proton channel family protein [bacterium]
MHTTTDSFLSSVARRPRLLAIVLTATVVLAAGAFSGPAPLFAQGPQPAETETTETDGAENAAGEDAQASTESEGETDESAAESEDDASSESIFSVIYKGGLTMVGLAIISTIIAAFALERFFYFRNQQIDTRGYYERITATLSQGGLDALEKEIKDDDRLISRILMTGIRKREKGVARLEKEIEGTAIVEIGKLERGLNLLANLGNLAPLLGFFGTVVGMRASFLQFVNKAAPTAQDLAGGVEEALITTAAGLLVAIPTYLVHNLFIYYIDNFTMEVERSASAVSGELQ